MCHFLPFPEDITMPKTSSSNPFLKMTHLDLAYAVQRLVRFGKTTTTQVRTLAGERQAAIELLEARVAALKAAFDVDAPASAPRKYKPRAAKKGRAHKPAKVAKRRVGRPKGSKNKPRVKVVKVVKAVKAAKPAAKMSAKAAAARKVQGRYLGLRRQLSRELQAQASKIAQAEGVGAALKFVEANKAERAA
jgi:hypothetical protein